MSRISKMKLKDIINETDVILRPNDIVFICDDIEISKKFIENFNEGTNDREEVKKFLIDNEEYIDKEKFMLITVKNYKENIVLLEDYLSKLRGAEDISEIAKLHLQIHQQRENLSKALKLGKGIEIVLTYYSYDEDTQRYKIEIVDSREIIDSKDIRSSKYVRRFDELDSKFKGEKETRGEPGLEFVLQSMLLTDLYNVFPSEQFGTNFRTMLLENEILRRRIKTKQELEELKEEELYDEYASLIDSVNFTGLLPTVKNALREYAEYIDLDKLLLISAYRFNEALEDGEISSNQHSAAKEILEGIISSIKNNYSKVECQLQDKLDGTFTPREITYSVREIKECLSRFCEGEYLTLAQINDYKQKINSFQISLIDIQPQHIDIVFSKEELEKISIMSVENLIYVYEKNKWDTSKIIELYEKEIIPLSYIEKIKYILDLSDYVNFQKLNEYYNTTQIDQENKEALEKYKNYLNLYKEIFITGKNKEEIEEYSSLVIEYLVENLEEKEYKEAIKKYYAEGLITLDSIVEWSDSDIITELFNEEKISLEDIRTVGVDLGYEYLNSLYTRLANSEDIEYDTRIKYIESGLISSEDVISLYQKGLIMDEDLLKLAQKAVIPLEEAKQVIDNRQLEDRIKTARAKAIGWSDSNLLFHIDGIEKKHTDGILYTNVFTESVRKEKLIIDPSVRQRYIEMLGLYRIETDCSYDNPFYNYEFYATPDETGAIGANSVIIAERYFQNKDDERTFATNNATYFFKYKDFLVLSNLQKKDMIKERENIVFRTNHTIATNGKRGTWAENVLHNVLKTMLGSDLANLSQREKRSKIIDKMSQMYLKEECEEILELCKKIDSGEYICRADGIQYGKAPNPVEPNIDYNDEETR